MKTAQKFLVLLLVTLLALALPGTALAADHTPDRFVFGDNYTLESGETLDEGLFVMGGNAELQKDSTVEGDVVVMGGNLSADGTITGNILIMGGRVELGSSALVKGDISTLGGSLDKDPAATVKGNIISEVTGGTNIQIPGKVFGPTTTMIYPSTWDALSWLWLPVATLIMAALAMIVVMFLPKPVDRAAKALSAQPLVAGGMGLMTLVVSPFLLIALAITILLIPTIPVVVVALVVTGVFGWIALGTELGRRLAEMLKQDWHPALAAGMGTAALTFVAVGTDKILICVGWIVPLLVTAVGLGAVILTRFGTREYPGPAATTVGATDVAADPVSILQTPEEPATPTEQPPAA